MKQIIIPSVGDEVDQREAEGDLKTPENRQSNAKCQDHAPDSISDGFLQKRKLQPSSSEVTACVGWKHRAVISSSMLSTVWSFSHSRTTAWAACTNNGTPSGSRAPLSSFLSPLNSRTPDKDDLRFEAARTESKSLRVGWGVEEI